MTNFKAYQVWDGPTRWFHWINFVCVLGLAVLGTAILYSKELGITSEGKILLKTVHVWFGYVFTTNLGWRIVWAFFGNRRARWSAIVPFQSGYGTAFNTYVSRLIKGNGPTYLGHNPVARLMISLLLVLLIVQAVAGLVLAGTDIYYPPFGYWFASWVAAPGVDPLTLVPYDKTGIDAASWDAMRAFRSPFITAHYWTFYILLFLIAIHITGVVVTELREGGGLIS
ncbi:MAG: cytochrome b/b6 domain-containing protein, partial [Pseudomonadota bacterium]